MELIKSNTCRTCAHHYAIPGVQAQPQLVCRRMPPAAAPIMLGGAHGQQIAWQSSFPPVLPTWTCGEFRQGILQTNGEMVSVTDEARGAA